MNEKTLMGSWVRRFLLEHLVSERNLSHNTQASYRDTLTLLLPFASKHSGCAIDRMTVEDLTPAIVRKFLEHVESVRGCSGVTRNNRLAAVHSLAKIHWDALSASYHLGDGDTRGSLQEDCEEPDRLPRTTRNGGIAEITRPSHGTG